MLYVFCKVLVMWLCIIFFHFTMKGRNNIHKVKGAILAVNHASFLDPPVASAGCARRVYFLARKDLFDLKILGKLISKLKAVAFNRDAPDTTTLRNVIKLLKQGKVVLIFPEGTRSPDGDFLPGLGGIGLVALKAKVPIVPAYIKGAYNILPRHRTLPRLRKLSITYGEPIYLDKWLQKSHPDKNDYQKIADLVMEKIKELKETTG